MESKLSSQLLIRTEPYESACVGRTGAISRTIGNGKAGKLITRQRAVAIRVYSRTPGATSGRDSTTHLFFTTRTMSLVCIQSQMWKHKTKHWKTAGCSSWSRL